MAFGMISWIDCRTMLKYEEMRERMSWVSISSRTVSWVPSPGSCGVKFFVASTINPTTKNAKEERKKNLQPQYASQGSSYHTPHYSHPYPSFPPEAHSSSTCSPHLTYPSQQEQYALAPQRSHQRTLAHFVATQDDAQGAHASMYDPHSTQQSGQGRSAQRNN